MTTATGKYYGVTAEDYGLTNVHESLIRTLDVLDKICREHNIQYALHAGTLLGAVRDEKIIPWDDDMDISMTRNNYIKFENACRELKGEYYLNTIDTWVPRFVEDRADELTFIDIFIWDFISENKAIQNVKFLCLRILQGMLKRNTEYKEYKPTYRCLLFSTNLLGRFLARKNKIRLYNYVSQRLFIGKKELVHRANDRFYDMTLISDKEIMNEYETIILEGHKYMVNKRWKEILIQSYGENYIVPPQAPSKEWKPTHEKQRKNFLNE